ncbi:MAG: glycosyltransferase [Marinifilaceae bacterium]|jgi:glycosyltransferase involved in cell wall biosynthesis|nr:glycosyltransferase [Marinifilaceae bacterium]
MNKPLVSIKTMAYNHGPYIKKCIEGVLMQKTNFKFQFVIAEDYSSDETREICIKYAKKYPNIINLIISDTNVGARKNSLRADNLCEGKYIAFCEGDDYWSDPYKLQKQVDFLERNPDYGLVHTAYSTLFQNDGNIIGPKMMKIPTGNIFEILLRDFNKISTLTILVRADVFVKAKNILKDASRDRWKMGDLPLWLGVAKYSKIGYLKDNTAVYRVLEESASHSNSNEKIIDFFKSSFEIRRWFCKKFNLDKLLVEINENELYFLYYKTLVKNMPENILYRNKIKNKAIKYISFWKIIMKLTTYNKALRILFRKLYLKMYH